MDIYELIKKAKDGDKYAEEKLIKNNINLIYSIIKRINKSAGNEEEDLFQIGCIGLLKAIKKFDFNYNVKFSTYAFPLILGEIKMHLREDGDIKVSRVIKKNAALISRVKEDFWTEEGREPRLSEISELTGLSICDISMALNSRLDATSIDVSFGDEDKRGCDIISDDINVEEEVTEKIVMKEVLKRLSKEERSVIILRFIKEERQKDIGRRMGVSQVKVSRLEKNAITKLRKMLS